MIDLTPFDEFNDFFAWYVNIVKAKVRNFDVSMGSDEIHLKIGKLTREEFEFTNRVIRKLQKFPKGINLVNDNKAGTFYCRWNNVTKKAEIAYPSVTYYWLRYPNIVKAAMQHEIGHIINEDILYKPKDKAYQMAHARCINMSQDCRINQNIDYTTLDYINRCLFTFENKPTDLIVPETWMVKQCGLPLSLKTKATWTYIHDNYHYIHPEPLAEDALTARLDVGTYVRTTIEKHGEPIGTYGIVISIILEIGKQDYLIGKISQEEIDALNNEDYKFFEELMTNEPVVYPEIGVYEFNRTVKELAPLQKPILSKAKPPKVGDIALTIEQINSIPETTFGLIVEKLSETEFTIIEFSDKIQKLIGKGDAVGYFTALQASNDLFTSNKETGIYLENFILRNLNPPQPKGDMIQKEKQIERPLIGDVVVISEGVSKGKYGVIINEDSEANYTIKEVSEEVAKAMIGKK